MEQSAGHEARCAPYPPLVASHLAWTSSAAALITAVSPPASHPQPLTNLLTHIPHTTSKPHLPTPPHNGPRPPTASSLPQAAAEGLVRKLEKAGAPLSVAQLNAKVQRLTRIVPDLDLAQLVDRDVGVLDTEPGVAIRNLVREGRGRGGATCASVWLVFP